MSISNFWTADTLGNWADQDSYNVEKRKTIPAVQVSFQMKPAEQAEVLKNLNLGSSRYPSFLDGFSKATDNIRLQRHGKRGMDGEKTNVDVLGQV
jgi:hypothetical protein